MPAPQITVIEWKVVLGSTTVYLRRLDDGTWTIESNHGSFHLPAVTQQQAQGIIASYVQMIEDADATLRTGQIKEQQAEDWLKSQIAGLS